MKDFWTYEKIENKRVKYHEFAHFLIAPLNRKHIPNFGLGPTPDQSEDTLRIVSDAEAFQEEELAATLGIIYEINDGINPAESIEDHISALNSEQVVKKNLFRLKNMGLINESI